MKIDQGVFSKMKRHICLELPIKRKLILKQKDKTITKINERIVDDYLPEIGNTSGTRMKSQRHSHKSQSVQFQDALDKRTHHHLSNKDTRQMLVKHNKVMDLHNIETLTQRNRIKHSAMNCNMNYYNQSDCLFSQTLTHINSNKENEDKSIHDEEEYKGEERKKKVFHLRTKGNFSPLNDKKTIYSNINPITVNILKEDYDNYTKARTSIIGQGPIKSYSVNSYQGIVRNYNEDRVSICVNISKPQNFKGEWPRHCSYFGVFDGHSGNCCCDFLRENLLNFILDNEHFNIKTDRAIYEAFNKADKFFMSKFALNKDSTINDRSGSCALIALIVDDKCYIANVGDSRAIVSRNKGSKVTQITTDHKPSNIKEMHRIMKNGGTIYRSNHNEIYRTNPGKLSVSRTIGDALAKVPSLGGNPGVIVSTPDIYSFQLSKSTDFVVLCTDGICDKLSNDDIIACPWIVQKDIDSNNSNSNSTTNFNLHSLSGLSSDLIIKLALKRLSHDNVTCVFISFEGYEDAYRASRKKTV